MRYTVLGATGFIGSSLAQYLKQNVSDVFVPPREYKFSKGENLGHLIYCIGLTADFRQRPMDTVRAHICKLVEVLENSDFESFLYLSSARVYSGGDAGRESDSISVNPSNYSDLYNISKLMGESVCLSIPNEKVRIVRLSNVIGRDFNSDNFLFSLIREAVQKSKITLNISVKASKDYVTITDAVKIITLISRKGVQRIYNLASGFQISNEQIINKIKEYTNCQLQFHEEGEALKFPQISIEKIKNEFGFAPENILDDIESLIQDFKKMKA